MIFKGVFRFFIKIVLLFQLPTVYGAVTTLNDIIATLQARGGNINPDPRGKYVPDLSGRYHHRDVPYNGGYGDRGIKYAQATKQYDSPIYVVYQGPSNRNLPFMLGPNDHLRFMIDFNFNGTGWQIIQFEWVRDSEGDEINYNYTNENKLWGDRKAAEGGNVENNAVNNASQGEEVVNTNPINNENDDIRFEADTGLVSETSSTSNTATSVENSEVENKASVDTHGYLDGAYEKNEFSNVSYSEDSSQHAGEKTDIQRTIQEVLEYIKTNIIPTLP